MTNAEGQVEIDAETVDEILSDGADGSLVTDSTRLKNALQEMEDASNLEDVVEAQALVIDFVRPNTPLTELSAESNLGISSTDALTSDANPLIRFTFDTELNDGTAAVEGDILEIFNTGITVAVITLTQDHIDVGYIDYPLTDLSLSLIHI